MSYANDMPTVEKVARTDAGLAAELRLVRDAAAPPAAPTSAHPDNELSLGAMAVLGLPLPPRRR